MDINEQLQAIGITLQSLVEMQLQADKRLARTEANIARTEANIARTEANIDKMMALFRVTHASIKGLENIVVAH
jgi:hypothetical protein